MKQIALSIQQMNHLQGLGVDTSNASMCWINGEVLVLCDKTYQTFYNANVSFENDNKYESAFTLQDILDILAKVEYESIGFPAVMLWQRACETITWHVCFRNPANFINPNIENESPLEAAYQMLCWCAKNGYLKHKEETK